MTLFVVIAIGAALFVGLAAGLSFRRRARPTPTLIDIAALVREMPPEELQAWADASWERIGREEVKAIV